MRMRSISLKLTIAFLFIGLLGAALVSLYVGLRARTALGEFYFDSQRQVLVAKLTDYYEAHGSWEGVRSLFAADHAWVADDSGRPIAITLTDYHGNVLIGPVRQTSAARVRAIAMHGERIPLRVNRQIVGYLIYNSMAAPWQPDTPESDFLERIQQAIVLSAITAGIAALAAGSLLARTLTRPIRKLTEATQAIADGKLGEQVTVTQQDELGTLAGAFNRMSADLAHTTRLRRRMTADIAHDLRTPLSILMGYTEALSDGKLQGNVNTYNVMHRETLHLNRLVNDLRLLSLTDAGDLPLNRVAMAPAELLERAAAAHQVQAEVQEIALRVDAAHDLPHILVDPERMAQVLSNLITNALRYTPTEGTITLTAAADDESVILTVSDTGRGIAPQDLDNVFERFYRGDPARQQDNGESGLGLSIVRSLVEAHDGAVTVESTVGAGSTFKITLKQYQSAGS